MATSGDAQAQRRAGAVPLRGSCLCGAIRYEVTAVPEAITHCHCSQCRKAHGAAFASYAAVPLAAFRLVEGLALVRRFRSSPRVQRSFCAACGSNLAFEWEVAPDRIWLAAGGFDDDPGVRPVCHIFVDSRAPWFDIVDALPQHAEFQPT